MPIVAYLIEYNRYISVMGIGVVIALAALFSHDKKAINVRLIIQALLLQCAIGIAVLKTALGVWLVAAVAAGVNGLYACADQGIVFLFGNLANVQSPWGFVFAIRVLPVMVFFGALTALLFHWGIIQRVVGCINMLLRPLLGTSGPETVCAVANSFLGPTESPLLIRSYLAGMTKSQLFVVMVSGMATISGAILAVYAAMGIPATHMLAASVMSIPGSIMIAKIIYPESDKEHHNGTVRVTHESRAANSFDAIATGTTDGLKLAMNVAAMLVAFLSLLALANYGLSWMGELINSALRAVGASCVLPVVTLDLLFSYLLFPFGFLLGFSGHDMFAAGQLLGIKVAVNELIAYKTMLTLHVAPRTMDIMTYALCGFSNFSSIGIQIGGIGALVPEKRHWLTELGLYAVLAGTLSNVLTALIASVLL